MIESAPAARATAQSPQCWRVSFAWQQDDSKVACVSADELALLRAENDRAKKAGKALRADQLV